MGEKKDLMNDILTGNGDNPDERTRDLDCHIEKEERG